MTTILASWELGRNFGHVALAASLARGLARRGVATAFATRDLLAAAAAPDLPFARVLQAPLHQRREPRMPTRTYAEAVADGGMADADAATVLVAAWLQLFDGLRPDGLAAEYAPASLLAAYVAGLKAVRCGTSWAVPPATDPLPSTMPWLPDDSAARRAAGAAADETVRTVCRRFGAPPLDGLAALLATAPRFLATWPEFDHYGAARDTTYYGPMTGLAATARPDWPPGDGPRVFVYLPGDHPAASALAAAVAELGWPTLWHGRVPPSGLAASTRFVATPVDIPYILGQAQLFAGRGGHATSCEALQLGKPQLVLPDTLETALLGWRLQARKLVLQLGEAPATAEVRDALVRLASDPEIAAATTAAAARYASYNPAAAEDALARDVAAALGLA